MLPRVFKTGNGAPGDIVPVMDADGHHFARVLRVKEGEPVVVAMDNGPWLGHVYTVSTGDIEVRIEQPYRTAEPNCRVVLVQGVAKGDKMDTILQKSVETGVDSLIVFQAARSVVRLDGKVEGKLDRWRKVIREAAMQAQRDLIPSLHYAPNGLTLLDILRSQGIEQVIVLDEAEESTGLITALKRFGDAATKRAVLVGPEGGWGDDERTLFRSVSASFVTLGPRILRTETAGGVALAIALAHFGDMGG